MTLPGPQLTLILVNHRETDRKRSMARTIYFTSPGVRLYLIVHRDAIGPADADIDQHHSLCSVEARPLYTWVVTPLSPE